MRLEDGKTGADYFREVDDLENKFYSAQKKYFNLTSQLSELSNRMETLKYFIISLQYFILKIIKSKFTSRIFRIIHTVKIVSFQ